MAAALLWSTSGLFAKLPLFDVWPPGTRGPLLAFWRAALAGMLLAPLIRRPRWRPALVPMTVCFAGMNVTFLSAVVLGTAANAIWLQSTSPLWVFAVTLLLTRDAIRPADFVPLVCGGAGIGLILAMELHGGASASVICGLLSGVFYAGVVLTLARLRTESAFFLIALNHLAATLVMLPVILYLNHWPDGVQLAVLACFGLFQMGIPYLLFARGLRTVPGHEAALLVLLEPVATPFWAYLARGEVPAWWTVVGGAAILGGLILRFGRGK